MLRRYHWAYLTLPTLLPHRNDTAAPADRGPKALRKGAAFREIVKGRFPLFKIGRFDPDKRWMLAAEAVARLKGLDVPVLWLVRGGMEPHGRDVLGYLG
jgi:hypothetical protein